MRVSYFLTVALPICLPNYTTYLTRFVRWFFAITLIKNSGMKASSLRLIWLFNINSPEQTVYGKQLSELRERTQQVQHINDFFFAVLDNQTSSEKVLQTLRVLSQPISSALHHLQSSGYLEDIRGRAAAPSKKVTAFLDSLGKDIGLDLLSQEAITGCLDALQTREQVGMVNALLVKSNSEGALVVPLRIKVKSGTGQVHAMVPGSEDFKKAIERARHAMCDKGFLRISDDVLYTLDLTVPEYHGASIGLAAAVGMYGAAQGIVIDPYTSFTGDINLFSQEDWRVQGVSGLSQKLTAARINGCRRAFIPHDNLEEGHSSEKERLKILPVDNLQEVFLHLQAQPLPSPEDTSQSRKIQTLKAFCVERGWGLSSPRSIQSALQFKIIPAQISPLSIDIYQTGTHIPKKHKNPEYQALLNALQTCEESKKPIQGIQENFSLSNTDLRKEIRDAIEQLKPTEQLQGPHCEYAFRFDRGQERIVVKQYLTGTLQVQGAAGELGEAIIEIIVSRYKLHFPNAELSKEDLLSTKPKEAPRESLSTVSEKIQEIPLPYIGTDESGKGDYFGPMVIAGVLVDQSTKPKLEALGIKDSKLLSDVRCRELATQIREICQDRYEEVEISPERYNDLYKDFQKEKKNLNHLLAWGHARAIEDLLKRSVCSHAVADQFGDEHYIRSRLMEKGKQLQLIQLPKGERYLAVAAASILSRDRFLSQLEKLSQNYGLVLPKGASEKVIVVAKQIVEGRGAAELRKVAKLHHRTTTKILESE